MTPIHTENFHVTALSGHDLMAWATHHGARQISEPFVCLHLDRVAAEFSPAQARELAAALLALAHQAVGLNP